MRIPAWYHRLKAEHVPLETWTASLRRGRRLLWCLVYGAMAVEAALYAEARPGFGQAILPGLAAAPVSGGTVAEESADPDQLADFIKRQWGVTVRWRDPKSFYDWPLTAEPANWTVAPIADRNVAPALKLVIEALSVYPPGFVRETMGPLFLCGALQVGTDPVGGLTYLSAIYVVAPDLDDAGMRIFVRDTVHHEFSTLALSKGTLDEAAWQKADPAGFAYAIETDKNAKLDATRLHDDPSDLPALYAAGFMSRYAEASIRNDFNTYADAVFGHPADLIALMARYPRIQRKVQLFEAAYVALDPGFRDYFARVGLDQAGQP